MNNFKQGEYIYIPSEVTLYQHKETSPSEIEKTHVIKEPHHLMFIRESINPDWLRVFYDGELWSVKSKHTYALKETQ